MCGNLFEWNDLQGTPSSIRGNRGSFWFAGYKSTTRTLSSSQSISHSGNDVGFRLASGGNPLNAVGTSVTECPPITVICKKTLQKAIRRGYIQVSTTRKGHGISLATSVSF